MWTLILVTLIINGAVTGGVGVTTAFLDFSDEAKCRTAAAAMAGGDRIGVDRVGQGPNISPPAIYALLPDALSDDNL
jgi:hypothetical protein